MTLSRLVIGVLVAVGGVILLQMFGVLNFLNLGSAPEPVRTIVSKIPGQEFNIGQDRATIDIRKIRQGCPAGRDCIPSIDNPEFVNAEEAEQRGWIAGGDVVFGITHKGVSRAYPQNILNWHEIVNDTIAGDPILITFCPLCGTSIAFERTIEVGDQRVESEFGVSGKLVNSNLVMYDRTTETLWQQLGGDAIVGELVGQELVPFKIDNVLWKDWKVRHPDTEVLSRETGFSRDYDRGPYGSYEENRTFLFEPEVEDDRLHPKQVVWGIEVGGTAKAYSDEALAREGEVNDTVGGVNVRIERSPDSVVTVTNVDTGEEIIPDHSMWFAWFAFHEDTELFQ